MAEPDTGTGRCTSAEFVAQQEGTLADPYLTQSTQVPVTCVCLLAPGLMHKEVIYKSMHCLCC